MSAMRNDPGVNGFPNLFDAFDVDDPNRRENGINAADDTLASAYVGRLRGTPVFGWVFMPYALASYGIDVVTKTLKSLYIRYVLRYGWTEEKFFRVTCAAMEDKSPLSKWALGRYAQLYDNDKLSLGKLADMDIDQYEWMTGTEAES